MATFNGHRNWNHWNVSLWIGNDEPLYRAALYSIRHNRHLGGKPAAAKEMLAMLNDSGITKTPDGAPYTVTTILAALRGLE